MNMVFPSVPGCAGNGIAKNVPTASELRTSVHQSVVCYTSRTTDWIYIKFDIPFDLLKYHQ